MEDIKLPEEKIQQMAEQYAIKGAEDAIKEYYTGYNSPYKREITAYLEKIGPKPNFDIPDLTAAINKALTDKIENICNEVTAKTFIPLFNRIFSGEERGIVTTQDLYQKFGDYIEDREGSEFDEDGLDIEIKTSDFGMANIKLSYQGEDEFNITLWADGRDMDGTKLYKIACLPGSKWYDSHNGRAHSMIITLEEGKKAEIPITDDVLSNDFMAYLANLLIHGVKLLLSRWHEYKNYNTD